MEGPRLLFHPCGAFRSQHDLGVMSECAIFFLSGLTMVIKSPALSPVKGGRKTWRASKVSDRLTGSVDASDTSDSLRNYGNIFRKNSVSWDLCFSFVSVSTSLCSRRIRSI